MPGWGCARAPGVDSRAADDADRPPRRSVRLARRAPEAARYAGVELDPKGLRSSRRRSSATRRTAVIHAPSLNQAVTAALLRGGYLANATPEAPDTLAVGLTSRRVRTALGLLEGMRNGQSLGALLGYQLERGLHDSHGLAEVDSLVFALRKAFPLVADRLDATRSDADVAIEVVEARNVVDGLALALQVRRSGIRTSVRRSLPQ
jgi:hypothetical protein